MLTYISLSLPFVVAVLVLDTLVLKTWVVKQRSFWIVLTIMLLLTALFDQLLAGLPIVLYDETKTLGVQLGYAPVEDFLYTIVAVIGIGSLITHWSSDEQGSKKEK